MSIEKLYIKNMVCPRCISTVKDILHSLNVKYSEVSLGEVTLLNPSTHAFLKSFSNQLVQHGFNLLSDKKTITVNKIKSLIVDMVHHNTDPDQIGHLSKTLPVQLGQNYASLSTLFSEIEGQTIEQYLIGQKIEKAKELLSYNELTVSEIAYALNYTDSHHFSHQFKAKTNLSPTQYRKSNSPERKSLDSI
jgi:AraC-like DNA-binding protein